LGCKVKKDGEKEKRWEERRGERRKKERGGRKKIRKKKGKKGKELSEETPGYFDFRVDREANKGTRS